MPRILETSERAQIDLLKTRWYKNNYEKVKQEVKNVSTKFGFKVNGEDDNYGEISFSSKTFLMTVKIYQLTAIETSVDIFIECLKFLELGKNSKLIEEFYKELNKVLTFKGLSLHP